MRSFSKKEFLIKNFKFVSCLNFIDKNSEIEIYKYFEKIIYDELPLNNFSVISKKLDELGIEEFVKVVRSTIPECVNKTLNAKRKNIKENMLENYVIRNNKNQQFLQELNLKISLKTIPSKNIIIKDGDIIDIKF